MPRKLSLRRTLRVLIVVLVGGALAAPLVSSSAGALAAPDDEAMLALALERRRLVRADDNLARNQDRRLGASRVVAGADLRRLSPEPGELLSVTEKRFRALEFNVGASPGVKTKKVKSSFVARGVAFDSTSGLLAIAAVSRVLLFDVAKTRNNPHRADGARRPGRIVRFRQRCPLRRAREPDHRGSGSDGRRPGLG